MRKSDKLVAQNSLLDWNDNLTAFFKAKLTFESQNRDCNRSLTQGICGITFELRILFYASDLLARKMAAQIVTRL